MTILRKLAVAISNRATRWSSPGCKDWAEGLAREVDSIPGDWAALAWAIGSWRVLLRNPPKPLLTPAEIARAGRIYAGNREHVPPVFALIMVLQLIECVWQIGHLSGVRLAGAAIAACSAAYLAVVGWMLSRMVPRPEDMDDDSWIEFYRRELVRLRDLFSGFGAPFGVALAFLLASSGSLFSFNGLTLPYLIAWLLPLGLVMAWWLCLRPAEGYQRRIDALDSVLRRSGTSQ